MEKHNAVMRWSGEMNHVFTLPDLRVALAENSEPTLYRILAEMADKGTLVKVKRGLYATPEASLATISTRIDPDAYLSTGTVLAKKAIIGSIPARRIQAVKVGRPRTYRCRLGTIEHLSISPHLHFGYTLAYPYNATHHNHIHVDNMVSGDDLTRFNPRSGTQVQVVQHACRHVFGLDVEPTGDYDGQTRDAVRQVQSAAGLTSPLSDGEGWHGFLRAVARG